MGCHQFLRSDASSEACARLNLDEECRTRNERIILHSDFCILHSGIAAELLACGVAVFLKKGSSLTDRTRSQTDWLLILGFCGFLFFFGVNYFGFIGADEPRYAQIAREMLVRHEWITPILGGKPWLEKPVLYYWQAMLSYAVFGVHDWAARIPSAIDATLMVVAVYLFMRRFRPGLQLDAALITASAAGVIGFARAASPDMPLAAAFAIALLSWFGWYESGRRLYLAMFYVFLALGTLAKGPVALLLAVVIIILLAAVTRDWKLIQKTLWIPGILLFVALALPWYIAVQVRNPEFFRVFILEHNLARFGTNLYRHEEPWWYFVVVMLLALIPWTVFVAESLLESARLWWAEKSKLAHSESAFDVFLILWLTVPVVFFSISRSKLPGYILPAVPAGAILLAEYIRRHVTEEIRPSRIVVVLHSVVAVLPILPALMIQHILLLHKLPWIAGTKIAITVCVVLAVAIATTLLSNLGLRMLRFLTLIPVVLALAAVLKIGGGMMDDVLTARPLAQEMARADAGNLPAATFQLPRDLQYGLSFYRNQVVSNYDYGEMPSSDHVLVLPDRLNPRGLRSLDGRRISFLGNFPPQKLAFYWIAAAGRAR